MKALDNLNRKGRGGHRAGKRRSPTSYDDYSRSYSDDSYRKKGRRSRSASVRKGKRDSRSPASRSEGSYRQYSKHSDQHGSPRGDLDQGSVQRSKSAGSQGPKNPEENGHAEEKKVEAPAEEAPVELAQKD